jgi:hypothetical protein
MSKLLLVLPLIVASGVVAASTQAMAFEPLHQPHARMTRKAELMEDVPHIITVECRARACLTRTTDHISPILTGRRATTLPGTMPRVVAATTNGAA